MPIASHKKLNEEESIKTIRRLLKPTRIIRGCVPHWFTVLFRKAFPTCLAYPGSSVLHDSAIDKAVALSVGDTSGHYRGYARWVDHAGKDSQHGTFVCEPYDLDIEEIRWIKLFADKLGCDVKLDPNSYHFPGNTFRIVFFQSETNPDPD